MMRKTECRTAEPAYDINVGRFRRQRESRSGESAFAVEACTSKASAG